MSNALATRDQKQVTQFDSARGGLQITNSDQMWQMARFFADSELVPACYRGKPANILVAWQKGAELGLSPTQSLDGIAVINGRASLWGEATTAVVLASGLMVAHKSWHTGSIKGGDLTAHYRAQRRNMDPNEYTFSIDDAKMAGLWGKGTYNSYPKDMLMWKAKARAYRTDFADCLKGTMIREDMQTIDTTARVIDVTEGRTRPAPDPLLADESTGDDQTAPDHDAPEHEAIIDEYPAPDDAAEPTQDAAPTAPTKGEQALIAMSESLAARENVDVQVAEDAIVRFSEKILGGHPAGLSAMKIKALRAHMENGDIKF